MDPISATGIVIGLMESLGKTLQVLEDFASRFGFEKFGSNFKDAETAISISHSDLVTIQDNLHTTWMHSQPDELLAVLEDAERRLKDLRDSIQNLETLRSKLFLRWKSRLLLRRDIDVAKSSTVLALEMVEMIRVVQGGVLPAKALIAISR